MSFLRRLPPLFYLGLFPVVCLLWAWADSTQTSTSWSICRDRKSLRAIDLEASTVSFVQMWSAEISVEIKGRTHKPLVRFPQTGPMGEIKRIDMGAATNTWFPSPYAREGRTRSGELTSKYVTVPIWLVLLGYLPLWLSLTWWQARRRRKKREEALAAVGGEA